MWTTVIPVDALQQAQANRQAWLLLDARFDLADAGTGLRAYQQGHIPGAQHIDLEKHLSGNPNGHNGRHPLPDRQTLAAFLSGLGLQRQQQVVVYDQGNYLFAARAWAMLRWLGHSQVAVLDGGLDAWLAHGGALDQHTPPSNQSAWNPETSLLSIVSADELLAQLDTPRYLVVDARTAERFAGVPHPLDPRCGHIPNAKNRFFADNIATTGLLHDPAVLRQHWQTLIGVQYRPEQVVHQCGSGVTACVNLLAMAYAGLPGSQLYVGSWSEWASDGSRPIAV